MCPTIDRLLYCRVTAHTKSEGEKGKAGKFKGKVVISCHARDLAVFSTLAEFISVIQAVSIGRRDYRLELRNRSKPPVPDLSQLEQHIQWAIAGLSLALKRGSVFRPGVRVHLPSVKELDDIILGRSVVPLLIGSKFGMKIFSSPKRRRRHSETMDAVVTATSTAVHISSKPSLPGPSLTAKPIEDFPQKRRKLETGTHALLPSTSSSASSEAQGQASSSSAGDEPPAEEEKENEERPTMAAYILKAGLSRLLRLFKDKRTGDLMDDAERKMLIDELMSYLFSSVTKTRIGFTMGEDPAQPGGFRGEIVFKPLLQQNLPGVATKKIGRIVYSFEGLPDVVGLSCSGPKNQTKISFVILK
jgi:hypothetical protein